MVITIKDDGNWIEEDPEKYIKEKPRMARSEPFSVTDPMSGKIHLVNSPEERDAVLAQLNNKRKTYLRDMHQRSSEVGEYTPNRSRISFQDIMNLTDAPGAEMEEDMPEPVPSVMPESEMRSKSGARKVQRGGAAWRKEGETEWNTLDEKYIKQYNKKYSAPEEDYQTPLRRLQNYENRAGFSDTVINQLGINPFTIDVQAEVNKADSNLPKLFHHVFNGRVTWNDRSLLTSKERQYWNNVVKQYHAEVQAKVASKKKSLIDRYNYMMNTFDNQRKIELERAKRTYELMDKKIWIHNPSNKSKMQVRAADLEKYLESDNGWKLGQPYGREDFEDKINIYKGGSRQKVTPSEFEQEWKDKGWSTEKPEFTRDEIMEELIDVQEALYELNKPDPNLILAENLTGMEGQADSNKYKQSLEDALIKRKQELEKKLYGESGKQGGNETPKEEKTEKKTGPFEPGKKVRRKDGKEFTADENGFLPEEAYTK